MPSVLLLKLLAIFAVVGVGYVAGRAQWLREIAAELWSANDAGIPIEGVCLFPIIDRMDWNDENHFHNSGLWDLVRRNGHLERVIDREYAEELRHSQALLARCDWGSAPEDHANSVPPAAGLEEERPPVYEISVQGE